MNNHSWIADREDEIESRKLEHIKIVLGEDVNYRISTWFEYVYLIHNPLPEINLDEINMEVTFLGRKFNYPILIDSITGGVKLAKDINAELARLASKYNIPISCGSQKAGLLKPELRDTYSVIRDICPNCYVIANIGAQDLIENPIKISEEVISMIEADALSIHLNPLQEAIQLESKVRFKGVLNSIKRVIDNINYPVIIKETGAGIPGVVAKLFESIGVAAINIAGAGGTSWSAVEAIRNRLKGNDLMASIGETFRDWGIPTAASLIEVASSVKIPIIASGGIRTGLDILKSIVLGARLAGLARPFLDAYFKGRLDKYFNKLVNELRIGMFLVGASKLSDLKKVKYVLLGDLLEWVKQRVFEVGEYEYRFKA